MTLEEAIAHCQEKSCGNSECALEHKQLAEWLRELQNRRNIWKDPSQKPKSQLIRGACSSQIAMETMCKEEAYNEVLAILDTMQEEPVSIDFEKELYKSFGQVKDFTLGMRIAKWFYDMGKNSQEPVSSVWHSMDEEPIKGEVILVQTKDTFYGVSVQKGGTTYKNKNKDRYVKWAYRDDVLNLSNVQSSEKNWKEEPVSEDLPHIRHRDTLDEFAYQCAYDLSNDWAKGTPEWKDVKTACKLGVQWQKSNLWKPADGDDLPEIDKEVIALEGLDGKNYYRVVFAHRVDSDRVIKTTIDNKPLELHPSKYGKAGWNLPNLKYWLDLELPNKNE